MNRKILFRGKRPNSGKWIEGFFYQENGFSWILSERFKVPECSCEVLPDTVGQFTGLTDKNGTKIFEGDIIKFFTIRFHNKKRVPPATKKWFKSPILWHEGIFLINEGNKIPKEVDDFDTFFNVCFPPYPDGAFEPEIIGNVHDNPELL